MSYNSLAKCKIITQLITFLICIVIPIVSCDTSSQRKFKKAESDSISKSSNSNLYLKTVTKIPIDSLLSRSKTRNSESFILGKIENLDNLFGFRGLKLESYYDSILFPIVYDPLFDSYSGPQINSTYEKRGLITVDLERKYEGLFSNNDNIELTFYRKKLSQITLSNTSLFEQSFQNQFPKYFDTQYKSLVRLFGQPNIIYKSIIPDYASRPKIDRSNPNKTFEQTLKYLDKTFEENLYIDVEWISKKVSLRFKDTHNEEYNIVLGTKKFFETSSIKYSLLKDEKNIENLLISIGDSIKKIKNKTFDKELIKKF
jgi:hypothetical protein